MRSKILATAFAILAAALYAVNVPFSKILLTHAQPTMMAAFLYLGAGIGLAVYRFVEKKFVRNVKREPLTKNEMPYTVAMVLLDVAAPHLSDVRSPHLKRRQRFSHQ